MTKVFVGHDWAEALHDVHVEDDQGRRLARARLPEGVEGVSGFHELVVPLVDDPAEVTIATETDRGLFVGALVASGYRVLAVNPMSRSRYRERHSTSGAKSDPGDAFVLAELARTDSPHHRAVRVTVSSAKRSRSSPALIRAWSGPGNANSISCARRCASSIRLPLLRSTSSGRVTRWRSWRSRRHQRWDGACHVRRSPPHCVGVAANAVSMSARSRSRPRCAANSSKRSPPRSLASRPTSPNILRCRVRR
jgi:hypothetical protein